MEAERAASKPLPFSRTCFVCGEENAHGLGLRFEMCGHAVRARWLPREAHCGFRGTVHGGVTATALDECMGWAAAQAIGRMCLTATLSVRYRKRVETGRSYTVQAEIVKSSCRHADVRGTLTDESGTVYATAEGRFLPMSAEDTLAVDDWLIYSGGEARLFDHLRQPEASRAAP